MVWVQLGLTLQVGDVLPQRPHPRLGLLVRARRGRRGLRMTNALVRFHRRRGWAACTGQRGGGRRNRLPDTHRGHGRRVPGALGSLGPGGIAQVAKHPRGPVVVAPALRVVALPVWEALRPVLPGRGSSDELLTHDRGRSNGAPLRGGLAAAVPPTATVAATRASNRRHRPPSRAAEEACEADWATKGHRLLCCTRGIGLG